MQSEGEVLPSAETELLGHVEQAPSPAESLNVSEGHAEHEPPSLPVKPLLQMQSVRSLLA